ncbi:hypothetical protein ACROYT_G041545 [Oculina patagonica]
MDDHWVRLFNVSDPRRAYAGHTLYKVTSKVFQKEFPEGATEIAVWRRFSDFKKLHQELAKIYIQKHSKEEEFPPFPKAKFFGRFDEPVIEERRKAALELLTFAGSIPDLFTSQPFVKFFEGGFPDSPIGSDSMASREGSSSDTEGESFREGSTVKELDACGGSAVQNDRQSPSSSGTSSRENGDNLEDASTLGGVWLCKQPSLTEGLDNLSSDEEENERETMPPAGSESEESADLTRQSNEGANENNDEEPDDVFTHDLDGSLDNELDISEKEDRASSAEPPNWLVRAISICSEGEDLEVLASEADSEELSFPQAFSEYELSNQEDNDSSRYPCSDSTDDLSLQQDITGTSETSSSDAHRHDENQWSKTHLDETSDSAHFPGKTESSEVKDSSSVGTTEDKQSFTSSSDSGKRVTRQRTLSDLADIYIHPKESDYLYAAGHTIHKALECEVNGKYEEAFSLYKTCVGLLLSGVQGEKDVKRREAVRRKTAQYLLKAEALYNAYLVVSDSPEKSEQDSSPLHAGDLCKSDDLQRFKDLTLADLKVMGIVGKVILVENIHNGETFVVKALCKSGPTRTHQNSQGSECQRRKSVRRLYGKYPNIVRLYKYFETATTIYLLLEYARGGRLWDHISCYQRNKDSHDYLLRNGNRKTTELKKSASDSSVTQTKTVDTADARPLPQFAAMPLEGEKLSNNPALESRTSNSSTMQDSELAAKVVSGCKDNYSDRLTTPLNGNNNKTSGANLGVDDVNKDSVNKCSGKVSPSVKSSLFAKLDEYFSSSARYLPDEHTRVWAAELVLAVAYLHTSGIICRDLNPKNVLLDEEGHILLTYFGSWEETEHIPDEAAMNHFYCAPEMWQVEEVTAAADWWSVGVLLYEIITGQALSTAHPWGIKTHTELHLPNKISPEAKSLLRELLRVSPSERLGSGVNGVEEIKSHPYFSGVNWTWLCSRIN